MALNCGIIGLSSTGKTTIFNCISNTKAEIGFASKSNIGMCELAWEYYRDRRQEFKQGIEEIFPFGVMNMDLKWMDLILSLIVEIDDWTMYYMTNMEN